MPLLKEKRRLAKPLAGNIPCLLPVGYFDEVGLHRYRQAVQLKLEGIAAKRRDSPYVPGARTADWLKIKRRGATRRERFG